VDPVLPTLKEIGVTTKYYSPEFLSSLKNTTAISHSLRSTFTPESPRALIYTSGTTGLPKAVIHSTGRDLLVPHIVATYLALKPSDRLYTCMPLYHGAAHGLCVTPSIHAGCTIVLGRKFSHATFWKEVATSKATIIQYVGELCRYLLNAPPNPYERKHQVKMAWGNGMRPDVWEPFRERFNIPVIHELYAATDGLGPSFIRNKGPFTRGTIGLRGWLWNWRFGNEEVRVKMDVDSEDILRDGDGWAVRCGVDEAGQVLHRLDKDLTNGAAGYYGNDEASAKRLISDVFEKGDLWVASCSSTASCGSMGLWLTGDRWFKSGDMMRQDADGRLYFVDRLGDTFRWKSENVSTNEVADMLGKYPQIAETNVYGILVPGYDGRAGTASIVMADGVTEASFDFKGLAQHAREVLPAYAVPLFLRITPALEYTGTLKIQKGKLKKEGVDPELITGNDKIYWLPAGSDTYLPFSQKDWEAVKNRTARL
jgi:acyl-CoA synthetase (AMP-forming)/AMP-acid ligase II